MMLVRCRSSGPNAGDSRQQLACVAHRADGVADLVGDAGAQASERGELRLLDLLGHLARVLEEDQHRPRPVLRQRHELRADHGAAVRRDDLGDGVPPVEFLPPPGLEQVQEPWRDLAQQLAAQHALALEQPRGGLVDQPDAVFGVDDEDALAQVLDDELVQLAQVGDVEVALLHARLALPEPMSHRQREQRDGEEAQAGETRHEEIRASSCTPTARRRRSGTAG